MTLCRVIGTVRRMEPAPFILSALTPQQQWDAGLTAVNAYAGMNALLGWDAQLKSFAAALRRLGLPGFVTPAPEIFFTETSWQLAARNLGVTPDYLRRGVHVRFGPARFTRIFRGLPNYLAQAEAEWTSVLAPGAHPLRSQSTAPHAIRASLSLNKGAARLRRPDGSEISRIAAPADFIAADLGENAPGWSAPGELNGLDFAFLGDFSSTQWAGRVAAMQIKRLVADTAAAPVILLPWNLANPASCVPDLVIKYLRCFGGLERAGHLILLPFNATRPLQDQVQPHLEHIKRYIAVLADLAETRLFIARVTDLAGVKTFRHLNAVAWIDGGDPEAAWTAARLAACGLPSLTLAAELTEKTVVEVRDEFGRRFFEGRTLPAREMERVAHRARGVALPAVAAAFNGDVLKFWLGNLVPQGVAA